MDEINKIRKAFFTQGESKNAIARRFGRSWDTINRIVSSSQSYWSVGPGYTAISY